VKQVGLAVRQMGAQSVLSGAQMAKRFGLHTTDLEVLDLIFIRGEVSAGELAKATGLTSGSMTALIDRLMEKKYVTRREDPDDRRKTLVKLDMKAVAPIAEAYMPRQKAMFKLWSSYSATELAVIFDFIQRSTDLLVQLTDREHKQDNPRQPKVKQERP
jgi:DNA-binding MarR family transcriptional regulator